MPNENSSKPQIAVIGSGYWGKNLVRNYANLKALKLICDKNEMVLDTFREQYQVDTCLALNDVLLRGDITGVVVATPAETHFDIAREALLAGKHVYVEKPLVLEETEGLELIRIAHEKKLTLMVGHLLQYHPIFGHLKDLVLAGGAWPHQLHLFQPLEPGQNPSRRKHPLVLRPP